MLTYCLYGVGVFMSGVILGLAGVVHRQCTEIIELQKINRKLVNQGFHAGRLMHEIDKFYQVCAQVRRNAR